MGEESDAVVLRDLPGWEGRECWGMVSRTASCVRYPQTIEDVQAVYAEALQSGLKVGFWGNGRSYGDAALSDNNLLMDFSKMNAILDFDQKTGVLTCEPGVSLQQLWHYALPLGFWPPVVSGTMHTTMGGCIAANVHGKNNFKYGPWGDHVISLTLVTPSGGAMVIDRTSYPELFSFVVGGFGTLGAVTSVTVQMKRIYSGRLEVLPLVGKDLDHLFRIFEQCREESFDYVVGWLDAFPRGRGFGRGQIHGAKYLPENADPKGIELMSAEAQQLPDRFFGVVPKGWLWRFVKPFANRFGMRWVNIGRYYWMRLLGHKKSHLETHAHFNFLLDFVPDWKNIYRPGGLIQYQLFLPKEVAKSVVERVLRHAQSEALEPWLVVMKRHRADEFPLSHGLDGYSFAMDFSITHKNREATYQMTRQFSQWVVEAGGKFYFAKDGVISSQDYQASLEDSVFKTFFSLKDTHDPEGLIQGNLYRRIFLPMRSRDGM